MCRQDYQGGLIQVQQWKTHSSLGEATLDFSEDDSLVVTIVVAISNSPSPSPNRFFIMLKNMLKSTPNKATLIFEDVPL